MKNFIKVIKDIDFNFNNITLFTNLLNSVIIFLVCFLILTLFRYNIFYSIIPSGLYFLISTATRLRKKHYLDIENAYPSLYEKLRTAVDHHKDVDNPIVNELKKEVTRSLKTVSIGTFFASRAVSYKILSSILISFLIVFLAVNGIHFDFSKFIENLNNNDKPAKYAFLTGNESGDDEGTAMDIRAAGGTASDDIYGEQVVAQLGMDKLDLVIKPSSYEVNLGEVEDPERMDFPDIFPDEIFSSSAESYEENIPKDQQDLVKNYFEKITQG
tara:strand:- start:1903 stop:2715 length:813 start_codon:yes stop_codon:yes gene_type:complete